MNAIILAAGMGKRAKLNLPKQLMRLGGKPVLIHIIELFKSISEIDKIIITVIPDAVDKFDKLLEQYGYTDILCIAGGDSRQESVYVALQYCDSERVIIHEAARPFITKEHVLDLINTKGQVIVPALPISPTVYYADGYYLDRDKVMNIQLPQVFDTEILKFAHENAIMYSNKYTDDSSLVCGETCIQPTIIDGREENIKITSPLDVKLAEVIFRE